MRFRSLVVPILLTAVAGCENAGPRIQNVHPEGARALDSVAAGPCRNPSSAEYAACVKAAEILEKSPREATEAYLANWNHVVFEDAHVRRPIDPLVAMTALDLPPPSSRDEAVAFAAVGGALLIGAIAESAVLEAHEHRIDAAARITTAALRRLYEASGDPYSLTMLRGLRDVRFRDGRSFDRFAQLHDDTLAAAENGTLETPHPDQMRPEELAAARPTGRGPVPFEVRGRWIVVEAGQHVRVRTPSGSYDGTITACSTAGIVLSTGADALWIKPDDLLRLDR